MLYNFEKQFVDTYDAIREVDLVDIRRDLYLFIKNIGKDRKYSSVREFDEVCNEKKKAFEAAQLYILSGGLCKTTASDICRYYSFRDAVNDLDSFIDAICNHSSQESKERMTKPSQNFTYTGDFNHDCCEIFRDLLGNKRLKISEDTIERFKSGNLSSLDITLIKKEIAKFYKANYSYFKESAKMGLSSVSVKCFEVFRDFGFYDKFLEMYNRKMLSVGLDYLVASSTDKSKKDKALTKPADFFDQKVIEGLDFDELLVYHAFCINRFEKVKQDIARNLMIFSLLSKNTKKKMLESGRVDLSVISDEELKICLARYNLISNHMKDRLSSSEFKELYSKSLGRYAEIDLAVGIDEKFCEDYEEVFGVNSFYNNIFFYNELLQLKGGYRIKDLLIKSLVLCLTKNNDDINWGIVIDNQEGMVEADGKVLLAFDIPDFNLPVRLHVDPEYLVKSVAEITGDTIVPVYHGDDDFHYSTGSYDTDYLSTILLFKLSKEQRDRLKEDSERENAPSYVRHLRSMNTQTKAKQLLTKENEFIDLLSYNSEVKVNPPVKCYRKK